MIDPSGQFEYSAVLHVHSRFSDGSASPEEIIRAAQAQGVDVLWLTDHDTLAALRQPGPGYYGHVLFLVASEITPAQNHYLSFGLTDVVDHDLPWPEIAHRVRKMGGLGFVAHPDDVGNPVLRLPSYRWTERSDRDITGLEIWNHLSSWSRSVRGIASALWAAGHPANGLQSPPAETLAFWDYLGLRRPVVGIGGSDAHAVRLGRGPFRVTIFSYSTHFRTIRTHFYTPRHLTGQWREDEQLLLAALQAGNVSVVNAWEGTEKGFRFWAEMAQEVVTMGQEVSFDGPVTLRGLSPIPVNWQIIHNGMVIGQEMGPLLRFPAQKPGVWRVVLRRLRSRRFWIYSNPIYLRDPSVALG